MLPQSTLDAVDAPAMPVNMVKREAPVEEGDGHASKVLWSGFVMLLSDDRHFLQTRIINLEKDIQALHDHCAHPVQAVHQCELYLTLCYASRQYTGRREHPPQIPIQDLSIRSQ